MSTRVQSKANRTNKGSDTKSKRGAGPRATTIQSKHQRVTPSGAPANFIQLQRRLGYQGAMQYLQAKNESPTVAQQSTDNNTSVQAQVLPQKLESQEPKLESKQVENVQAKLTMGQPGDKFEKEADQAAARVVAGQPVQALSKVPSQGLPQALDIQREEEGEEYIQKTSLQNTQLENQKNTLQAAVTGSQSERNRSQSDVNLEKRLQSAPGGRPLSRQTEQYMGEKFNHDFSDVRIHDNAQAQKDAASLGARAFTKSNDIWLGAQASENDQSLMGHELAHVVQQSSSIQKQTLQKSEDSEEKNSTFLDGIANFFRNVPGYQLLSVAVGRDLISGDRVERSASNVIQAVIGLIPGGRQLYDQLNESGAVDRAGMWLSEQIALLGFSWSYIKSLFKKAKDSLGFWDIFSPSDAIEKVKAVFVEPINRVFNFAKAVGSKIMEFVLEGALSLAGSAGSTVMNVLRGAGKVFMSIIRDPIGFLGNLLTAVKQGFGQFSANIWTHLQNGLVGWIFGALASSGLQLPESFSLKGILSIVLQVLNLTWASIRERIVKVIGEKRMARIEKTASFITDLITRGPIAAWEMISGAIGNLKDMVLGAIQEWVVTKVVKSAVTKLASMFNPVGAIIQAGITIYNTVMFFIERAQQIASLVQSITSSIGKIAAGAVGAAANFIELSMAKTIPVIISFLARFLQLSGIGETIKGVIKKIQKPVNKALDSVVSWVVKKANKLFGKGKGKGGADKRTDKEKKRDLELAIRDSNIVIDKPGATPANVQKQLPALKKKYGLTSIELVNEVDDKYFIDVKVNPEGKTETESLGGDKKAFKYAEGIAFRADLKHHLAKFDGLEKHGIKGAHNLDEFLNLEKNQGINILNKTKIGNGIYQIEYQIPKYFGNNKEAAKFGKKAGDFSHFKAAKDPKTVYDPAVWNDDAFLEFSQKAASQSFTANAQKFLANDKARIYNTTYEGIDFRIYLDKDRYGNIYVDNIHPRGNK